jgi:hypothetical protein
MDFLRIIKSIEELLYELITWLVFYPRTMWRIVRDPVAMARYSDEQQQMPPESQYADALSPPLLLMLTVLIAHGIEVGLGDRQQGTSDFAKYVASSEQNMLIMRSVLASTYALMGATTLMRRRGIPTSRAHLRTPFFSQCYVTAPFQFVFSIGATLGRVGSDSLKMVGLGLALVSLAWYLATQAAWFSKRLPVGQGKAWLLAAWVFLQAATYVALVNLVVLRVTR